MARLVPGTEKGPTLRERPVYNITHCRTVLYPSIWCYLILHVSYFNSLVVIWYISHNILATMFCSIILHCLKNTVYDMSSKEHCPAGRMLQDHMRHVSAIRLSLHW